MLEFAQLQEKAASTTYDLLVIGWGKAGKTLAKKAASSGKSVAIIERDPKMYGGTCINVGCLPTKSLVHHGKVVQEAELLGWQPQWAEREQIWEKALEYKRKFVAMLNKKNFGLLDNEETADVYLGVASFVDNHSVRVQMADGELTINADRIVINTGATPRLLPIPGADASDRVMTSEGILELDQLPKRLLVIGAGFIGLEFASYFAAYGSQVDVFQFDGSWLPTEDRDDAEAVAKAIEAQGIKVHFNTSVKLFEDVDGAVEATVEGPEGERTETYDTVLVAAGRVPATEGLNVEASGIELGRGGAVVVDEKLRTGVENIWAAGDVKGGPAFTFISLDDSRIIWPQLFGAEPEKTASHQVSDRVGFATCTFIDPPFARVGMNEKQAEEAGVKYTVKKLPTAAIPKAHVIDQTAGHTKVLIAEDDTILGATVFHYEAHEMVNLLTLAIKAKVPYQMLRDFIYTHPTFTESLNDVLA